MAGDPSFPIGAGSISSTTPQTPSPEHEHTQTTIATSNNPLRSTKNPPNSSTTTTTSPSSLFPTHLVHQQQHHLPSSDDSSEPSPWRPTQSATHIFESTTPEGLEMVSFENDNEANLTSRHGRSRSFSGRSLGDRLVMDATPEASAGDAAKDEKKRADMKVLRHLAVNGIFIGLWYTFSLLISLYNKWMFAPEHLDFKFPLFITSGHMIVQFSLASLVLFAFPHLRPGAGLKKHHSSHSIVRAESDDSDEGAGFFTRNRTQERKKQQEGVMTRWFYLTRLVPCGAATGLDIGLGNMSLKLISLAFYTMCKSSSLAFVLIFAFIFRLEQPTWRLVGIISIMTAGVVMMVAGEAKFNVLGFVLVMTASALSGLRWSLTQVLLLRNPATSNPFSSIFFLAPVMFLSIFVIAVPVEGFSELFARFAVLQAQYGLLVSIAIVLFPGVIAFMMVSSEFALLQRTSVVTLSICGIFKEVLTISVATIVFGDPLTAVNVSGLIVTIVSIAAYNYLKIRKLRRDTRADMKNTETAYVPVDSAGDESDLESEEDSASEDGNRPLRTNRPRRSVDEGVQAGDGRVSYEEELAASARQQ